MTPYPAASSLLQQITPEKMGGARSEPSEHPEGFLGRQSLSKIKRISNLHFLGFLCVVCTHGHGYACGHHSLGSKHQFFFFFEAGSLSGLELTDWQGWPESLRNSPVPTCPALGSHLWTPEIAFGSCAYRTSISLAELPSEPPPHPLICPHR